MLEIRGCYQAQLSDLLPENEVEDLWITGLCTSAQQVCQGDLLVQYAPSIEDLQLAKSKGVVAVCCAHLPNKTEGLSIYKLDPWQASIGRLLKIFYEDPSSHMQIVGVTGTNGKTSVSYLVARALQSMKKGAGYIGTLGHGVPGDLKKQLLTTPSQVDIHHYLAELRDQSVEYVALEASSHGLKQGRLSNIAMDIGVFTNLTHDHLDYHKTINAYLDAKRKLFVSSSMSLAIINVDDPSGQLLSTQIKPQVWACSLEQIPRSYPKWSYGQVESFGLAGQRIEILTHQSKVTIQTKLLGEFNAYNLIMAHAALSSLGISASQAAIALSSIDQIPSRMMVMNYDSLKPKVLIDFAHTPDALMHVLKCLKAVTKGKLWVVFGCGGMRDQAKRPNMGRIAESIADMVCITQDNSRGEAFTEIAKDILSGMSCPSLAMLSPCRYAAIESVLSNAKQDDVVLIAGMGDARSYIVSMNTHMSDIEIVESLVYDH